MKFILFLTLIMVGCSDHSGPAVPLDAQPELFDVDYVVMDRMEEYFGDRVAIEDVGEFDDGEHYSVKHAGISYDVVYDVELDQIISVSKAGTH